MKIHFLDRHRRRPSSFYFSYFVIQSLWIFLHKNAYCIFFSMQKFSHDANLNYVHTNLLQLNCIKKICWWKEFPISYHTRDGESTLHKTIKKKNFILIQKLSSTHFAWKSIIGVCSVMNELISIIACST